MLKSGAEKRIPLVVPTKKLHSANLTPAGLLDSSVAGCNGGSLEVVSLERFQQQLEAMSSLSSSNDCIHTERHGDGRHGDAGCSWQPRTVRSGRGKRNAPIVVCLRESIRAFGRGKTRPVSAAIPRRTLSESSASDVVVKLSPFGKKAAAAKNFNAFLSAVEKAHAKDIGKFAAACSSQNINPTVTSADREPLNNTVGDHRPAPTDGQLDLSQLLGFHGANVEVIHNDLSATSDDQSEKSEDSCSSRLSGTESDAEATDESSAPRKNDGGATCEVLPQHCPQCLAACYAYTHYYALGSKYFKIEVIEDEDGNSAGLPHRVQTEPNSPTWVGTSYVHVVLFPMSE